MIGHRPANVVPFDVPGQNHRVFCAQQIGFGMADHHYDLYLARGFAEQAADLSRSIRVGLGEVIVEQREAAKRFVDDQTPPQGGWLLRAHGDVVEGALFSA